MRCDNGQNGQQAATCRKLPVVAVASCGNPICPYAQASTMRRCLYKVMRPIFDIFWRSAHAARGGSCCSLACCSGGTTHNSCALYLSQSYALRSCADMDSGIMPQTEWGMPAQAGSSSRNGFQGTPTASQVSCWCCSAAAGVVAGAEAAAGVGCCNCHCRCLSFALANQDLSPAHTTRRGAAFTWLLSGWRCLLDCYLHFGIE